MDYAWVVGGGRIQADLIKAYQREGLHVCIGDADVNCYANQIDGTEVFMVDTHDAAAHLQAVIAYSKWCGERPKAVATAGTDVGPSVSLIAQSFGLRAAPYSIAKIAKDKALMRWMMKQRHPWWSTERPLEYPCVEKPTCQSGSRGVRYLTFAHEFEYKPDHIWEEVLSPHDEASTDWMVVDGIPIYVNGAARIFDEDRFGLEIGYTNPFNIDARIQEIALTACARLGVTEGPFKMDLINDRRYGWCLLECSTRWSGSFDHTVAARLSTGRELSQALVDYSLGREWDDKYAYRNVTVKQCVGCYTPPLTGEWLITEDMLVALREAGAVEVIALKRRGGTVTTLRERPLFIFATGPTLSEAFGAAKYAWEYADLVKRTGGGGGE